MKSFFSRNGMAIPAVLAIALILGILGLTLIRGTREQNRQNLTGLQQLQGHFLVQAGFQHAMLKVKHLGRELYDSACIAQGLNPLFDFSRPVSSYNPGPIFLYRKGEASPKGYMTADLEVELKSALNPPQCWLNAFRNDLVSDSSFDRKSVNSPMSFDHPPFSMHDAHGGLARGRYAVTGISIAASAVSETEDRGTTNRVVVELTVESDVISSHGERFRQEARRSIRVSRE
ncbi:MAG: hypothetical protein HQM09_23075 [Candidatus Riflebacteria bacterium]|nr:hypothetical protein [Candidatus Riflebacteria bacterium]